MESLKAKKEKIRLRLGQKEVTLGQVITMAQGNGFSVQQIIDALEKIGISSEQTPNVFEIAFNSALLTAAIGLESEDK